jgi:ubiquinone/menaquinone biosynthesis C-methylase UbiE
MNDAATSEKGHRWFAALYDRISRGGERAQVAAIRQELLRDLRGDVLEIGAGTGANFEHYPGDARVVALEPDPHMLKRAKEKLRPNIELRQAPAEALPYPDQSFDVVVSTLVLCTVRDLPRSLSEIKRVLRPGGRLVFIEHIRAEGFSGRVQDVIKPVWSYFAAGCNVNRRTESAFDDAGLRISTLTRTKFAPVVMPVIYGVAEPASDSSDLGRHPLRDEP